MSMESSFRLGTPSTSTFTTSMNPLSVTGLPTSRSIVDRPVPGYTTVFVVTRPTSEGGPVSGRRSRHIVGSVVET